jgi:cleavage and polyadenylation specificity factor subunit 2
MEWSEVLGMWDTMRVFYDLICWSSRRDVRMSSMSREEIGKQHYSASHLPSFPGSQADISDIITRTLENHYSVLLPCDPSPRLLELLVLLDQHWSYKITDNQQARAQGREQWIYPLCLVSRTAADMVSFARSFIEWTGGVVRDAAAGLDEELTKKRRRNVTGDSYGALDFK